MENHDPRIDQWVKRYHREASITFKELTWGLNLQKPIFDYEVKVSYEGEESIGRGFDLCKNKAFYKAFSESFERFFFKMTQFKSTTNGFSCHTCESAAREKSRFELFERDLSCSVYYSGISLKQFQIEDEQIQQLVDEPLLSTCQREFDDFRFYRFQYSNSEHQAVMGMAKKDFSWGSYVFVSTTYSSNFKSAMESTILCNLTKSSFVSSKDFTITHSDKENHQRLVQYFLENGNISFDKKGPFSLKVPPCITETHRASDVLPYPYSKLEAFFAVTKSQEAQEIIKDPSNLNTIINIDRLQFLNPNISVGDIRKRESLPW